MRTFYNLAILAYGFAIKLCAPFHGKARKFVEGRKLQASIWQEKHPREWGWFHVSSLGEFEQCKPVISRFKAQFPHLHILLTFFSPSGYEVRHDDPIADLICYLPMDTTKNARNLVECFNLQIACFVKYDFWLNYLSELKKRNIPTILISAIFRRQQWFFKPWGAFYRSFLSYFDHILVQNIQSRDLLLSIGYQPVEITGDTRFDRVWAIREANKPLDMIESFKNQSQLVVFGSTWPRDHRIIQPVLKRLLESGYKIIIAPHEVSDNTIKSLEKDIDQPSHLFSKFDEKAINDSILIIDQIGLLSGIYRYADLAYVGGAFKGTLHNVLEPAVFGIPVLIGRHQNNMKFKEASDLIDLGGVFEVESSEELDSQLNLLLNNPKQRIASGDICKTYVENQRGATEKTISVMCELVKRTS